MLSKVSAPTPAPSVPPATLARQDAFRLYTMKQEETMTSQISSLIGTGRVVGSSAGATTNGGGGGLAVNGVKEEVKSEIKSEEVRSDKVSCRLCFINCLLAHSELDTS